MENTSAFPLAPPLASSVGAFMGSSAAHPPVPPVCDRPMATRTTGVDPGVGPEKAVRAAAGPLGWRFAGVTADPALEGVAYVLSRTCAPPAVVCRAPA